MKDIITQQLQRIEQTENLTILYAAESGSRAWGFESPDSDYDVRFIYKREANYYLRLDKGRDVVEMPISDLLDINGWDIDKALKLLSTSNPTLFEWCNSPIVYRTTEFFENFKKVINDYFKAKSGLYHYLNMADGNYREYLKSDLVKAKKYFYVVRPILACKWILKNHCPPPMLFSELCETMLCNELKPTINKLLQMKMAMPEIGKIPRIQLLNDYIEANLVELKNEIDILPESNANNFDTLNKLFLEVLELK